MKLLLIIALSIGFIVAASTVYGKAIRQHIAETASDALPPEVDVHAARQAIADLKRELSRDHGTLRMLKRDIDQTREQIVATQDHIAHLAEQMQRGAELLNNPEPYVVQGNTYTRSQIETQIEIFLSQRSVARESLRKREIHVVHLQQKLAEVEAVVAAKRLAIEEYESQLALLEIDVRFMAHADRYQVASGNTRIQEIFDRLSTKVESAHYHQAPTPTIDFLSNDSALEERIHRELAHP